jgi:hypothetical protein
MFDGMIEYNDIKLRTENGKICGELVVSVDRPDFDLAREEAVRRIEKLASLLTLAFDDGFIIEDVNVPLRVLDKGREKIVEVYKFIGIRVEFEINVNYPREKLAEVLSVLRQIEMKLKGSGYGEELLRAIKWWRRGFLEEDKVDKFLDCYIAFEMLASILGYTKCKESEERCKAECAWAKRFAEDYSITFRVGEMSLTEIRNNIMHAPGPEKDRAEKFATQHADRLCMELLNTIKKIISAI